MLAQPGPSAAPPVAGPSSVGTPEPGSEEEKYREKYLQLKQKSDELEAGNDKLHIKLVKAQREIYRLKVEKGFIFQRLDELIRSSERGGGGGGETHQADGDSDAGEREDGEPVPAAATAAAKTGPGGGKKRKQAGEKPDLPSPAPKKPPNAFIVFMREQREQGMGPPSTGAGSGALTKMTTYFGEVWKSLGEEDKKHYFQIAEDEKKAYEIEVAKYIDKHGVDPTVKRGKAKDDSGDSDEASSKKKKPAKKATPAKSGVLPQIKPPAPLKDPLTGAGGSGIGGQGLPSSSSGHNVDSPAPMEGSLSMDMDDNDSRGFSASEIDELGDTEEDMLE